MDYSTLTDEQLDQQRIKIITEQERRMKLAQLPDQLAAMTRDAVAAGCDPATIRDRVDEALDRGEKL